MKQPAIKFDPKIFHLPVYSGRSCRACQHIYLVHRLQMWTYLQREYVYRDNSFPVFLPMLFAPCCRLEAIYNASGLPCTLAGSMFLWESFPVSAWRVFWERKWKVCLTRLLWCPELGELGLCLRDQDRSWMSTLWGWHLVILLQPVKVSSGVTQKLWCTLGCST